MNKIEEKYGLKTGQAIALFVIFALNIIWLICDLVFFAGNLSFNVCATILITMFIFVSVAYYALYGYKKPHGNVMRYLVLFFSIASAILIVLDDNTYPTYIEADFLIAVVLSAYMSGRLDHYKQNLVICAIVFACQFVSAYYLINLLTGTGVPMNFVNFMACIGGIVQWSAISGGYIIRYQLHKEAGFADK